MSRTNPDLFEFFGKRRGRPTTSARAVSTPTHDRGGPVVTLSRRLAVLLAAGAVLTTALAFVGGLAVGRGLRGDGMGLVREVPRPPRPATWLLRGAPLPRVSNQSDSLEHRALAAIRERHPLLAPFVASGPIETGRGRVEPGKFRLIVRGFATEASATAWAKALSAERVGEYLPFRDCRPERAPD